MIPGSKGHAFHACMKKQMLGPAKHEKVARIGRISNVFRVVGAQSRISKWEIDLQRF